MNLICFNTYILICLLTRGHGNLFLKVKAVQEGSSADGTAADVSSALASSDNDPSGVVKESGDSSSPSGAAADAKSVDANPTLASGTSAEGTAESSDPSSQLVPANKSLTDAEKLATLDRIIKILDDAIKESELSFQSSERKDKDSSDAIKLFKENNEIEMSKKDYFNDDFKGNYTYAFKPGVECILVKFDDQDVWRTGYGLVEKPKSVTYDTVLSEVAVRDADKTAFFKKDEETGKWKHVVTMSRERKPKVLKRGQ